LLSEHHLYFKRFKIPHIERCIAFSCIIHIY
jgi:hypothetical protein